MRGGLRCLLLTLLTLAGSQVQAQIYACTAPDGTRVFSDEKCGPDAKVVPGITTKKRVSPAVAAAAKAARASKTAAELEALIERCNAGDSAACTAWTHGGGPNRLREQEREAELACEGGSLPACEERYCRDGINDECRLRVLQSAKIAGDIWYLREQGLRQQDGSTSYKVRCLREGVREIRDLTITCAGLAGPNRCYLSNPQQANPQQRFARLDNAASKHCSVAP